MKKCEDVVINSNELTGSNLSYPLNCQENDQEMEQRKFNLAKDIELEQQNMVNEMFNNPQTNYYSPPIPTHMPLVVPHATGFHVVLVPAYQTMPPPAYSSTMSTVSSDEGFEDGDESLDDTISLEEAFSDKLEIEEESEGECCIEEDEELNRLVLSIIDE